MLMRMCHTAVLCKSCTCSLRWATMSKLAPIDRACSHHCPLPNPRVQYKQPSPQSLLPAGWPSDRRPMLPSFITSPAVLLEHSETVIATPRHVRDERCEARHQPEEIRTKLKQRKDNSLRSVRTELCFTPQARPSWTCEVLSTRRRKYLDISNGAPRRRHGVNEYLSPMALQTVVVHAGPTRNNLTSIFWLDGWTVNSNFTTPHSHSLTHPRPGRPRAAQRRLFLLCTHVDFLVLGRPPSLEKSVQTPDRLSATTPRPRHRRTCRARQPSTHPTNHPSPSFPPSQASIHTHIRYQAVGLLPLHNAQVRPPPPPLFSPTSHPLPTPLIHLLAFIHPSPIHLPHRTTRAGHPTESRNTR